MSGQRAGWSLAACALFAAAIPAVAQAETLKCRAQVVFTCTTYCQDANQPADLSFDFTEGRGTFCRGSRCDEGIIETMTVKGQWDDRDYTMFGLRGTAPAAFSVTGTFTQDRSGFVATSDEIGSLNGTCEAG